MQYEPLVNRTLSTFLHVAHRDFVDRPDKDGIIDFSQYSRFFALDVISELTFGSSYGLSEAGKDTIGITKGRTGFKRYAHLVSSSLSSALG